MRTVLVLWWVVILLGLGNLHPLVRPAFISTMKSRRLEEAFHCRDMVGIKLGNFGLHRRNA